MSIRPKIGAKVRLRSWMGSAGAEAPPPPWTGEVVKLDPAFLHYRASYYVKRDFDGEILQVYSYEMTYHEAAVENQ